MPDRTESFAFIVYEYPKSVNTDLLANVPQRAKYQISSPYKEFYDKMCGFQLKSRNRSLKGLDFCRYEQPVDSESEKRGKEHV